jgi:RNase P/RNase MRP subunit POP5
VSWRVQETRYGNRCRGDHPASATVTIEGPGDRGTGDVTVTVVVSADRTARATLAVRRQDLDTLADALTGAARRLAVSVSVYPMRVSGR